VDIQVHYTFDVSEYTSQPLSFGAEEIRAASDACWNKWNTETSYQPEHMDFSSWNEHVACDSLALTCMEHATMAEFSDMAKYGAKFMHDHSIRQRLFDLEHAARSDADKNVARITVKLLHGFLATQRSGNEEVAAAMARRLNDYYIGIGWLEKYFLFEQYDKTGTCADCYAPVHTLSRPYTLLARLFGNHEEFTYYNHYVGSSCSNMESMRKYMHEKVEFSNPESIKRWVLRFEGLYDFQLFYHADSKTFNCQADVDSGVADPDNMPVPMSEFLMSERYFRFIHLAMEMIWSDKTDYVHGLFRKAIQLSQTAGSDKDVEDTLREALEVVLEVEKRMNLTFKTLVLGSNPAHYNRYVRPYIAGTWGRNCGTVFGPEGKFFEGLGQETAEFDGQKVLGKWKKHVGQTGAGTSVRPIADEFAGGVSDVYTRPLPSYFCLALMRDQQAKVAALCEESIIEPERRDESKIRAEIEASKCHDADEGMPNEAEDRLSRPAVSSLSLMLTMFRAVTRPYSHNYQIQTGKELFASVQCLIDLDFPEIKFLQLKLQLACLTHRLDHYYYVQAYINEYQPAGRQLRTAATGGTNTTDFLPDLIDSNMKQAKMLVEYFKNDKNAGCKQGSMQYDTLMKIDGILDDFAKGKANIKKKSAEIMQTENARDKS
jgi:hypothetical protein